MVNYLQSLLPRFKQYSKGLNDIASFADIPWAFMDDSGVKVTYIFRRQGDILVSRQGDVTRGTWEYLPQLQSLLIQAQGKERIYNQGLLLDSAVMVLRKDGTDELLALANPTHIPDLNVVRFLESFEAKKIGTSYQAKSYPKSKPVIRTLEDGSQIKLSPQYSGESFYYSNCDISYLATEESLKDGTYKITEDPGISLVVENGNVKTILYTTQGIIIPIVTVIAIGVMILLIFILNQ